MSLTGQRAQTATAPSTAPEVGTTSSTPRNRRLPSRRALVAAAVTLGVLTGAMGGYVAYHDSSDAQEPSTVNGSTEASERSLDAQSARWQGQADHYLAQQEAVERGRAADSARLQAWADAYLASPAGG